MALSDWDLLAFDKDGKSCNGIIQGKRGTKVEIYKNWVYVHDKDAWHESNGYVKDTVCEIQSGDIRISGFKILARRYEQQHACLAYIEEQDWESKQTNRMAGIGCSGYDDPVDRILAHAGKTLEDYPSDAYIFSGSYHNSNGEEGVSLTVLDAQSKVIDKIRIPGANSELDSQWVGVQEETYAAFIAWLGELRSDGDMDCDGADEWVEKVRDAEPTRANQGDMYFASRFGFDTPASNIGAQKEPLLMQMIKEPKE